MMPRIDRTAWIVWGTSLAVLLLLAFLLLALQMRHAAYGEALSDIEPRVARLRGLLEAQGDIKAALIGAQGQLAQYAYAADTESTRAAADMQQQARRAAERAGLSVVSSQALPPKSEGGLEIHTLTLNVQGSYEGVVSVLEALARQKPRIQIDGLTLQTSRRPGADSSEIYAQLRLVTWKMMP